MKAFIPVISDRALSDLSEIYNFIAAEDPFAAERFVDMITAKIFSLAASGNKGVDRGYIVKDLRAFPFKGRCIYFRVTGDVLDVVRVLHGRRDLSPDLFNE